VVASRIILLDHANLARIAQPRAPQEMPPLGCAQHGVPRNKAVSAWIRTQDHSRCPVQLNAARVALKAIPHSRSAVGSPCQIQTAHEDEPETSDDAAVTLFDVVVRGMSLTDALFPCSRSPYLTSQASLRPLAPTSSSTSSRNSPGACEHPPSGPWPRPPAWPGFEHTRSPRPSPSRPGGA